MRKASCQLLFDEALSVLIATTSAYFVYKLQKPYHQNANSKIDRVLSKSLFNTLSGERHLSRLEAPPHSLIPKENDSLGRNAKRQKHQ
jgi:hypothetical protein